MGLGSLRFRAPHHVAQAEERDGAAVIRGELEWYVEGEAAHIAALLESVGPEAAESPSPGFAILRFGNAVGRFVVGALGILDVRCGKLSERAFDAMLCELTQVASALPFRAERSAGSAYERAATEREQVRLHTFLYARSIILGPRGPSSVLPALEAITRNPHRLFSQARESTPLGRVGRADARTLGRLACGWEPMARVDAPSQLASALRGHLPTAVETPRVTNTSDTVENRFVKAFLLSLVRLTDEVAEMAAPRTARFWTRIGAECVAMRRVLLPYLQHGLLEEIAPSFRVPIGSTVLQRRRGYRDVLRHHLALRSAARLLPFEDEATERLLGAKDVATLYEVWCFFTVVRAVELAIGRPPVRAEWVTSFPTELGVARELTVSWNDDVRVVYNARFHLGDARRRSSSHGFRPDVLIEVGPASSARMHVLDAKLRRERVPGADGRVSHEQKDDDLDKMHTYRDALPAVRSAYVLFPGDAEGQSFPAMDQTEAHSDGVGAIPLAPGEGMAELVRHVRSLLPRSAT